MKKILILGAGIYQVPLIKQANTMGLYTIVASIKGDYPGFKLAKKNYYTDVTDTNNIVKIAQDEQIDAICTAGSDVALPSLGKVCDRLGLTGVSYNAAILATNKIAMKQAFMQGQVATPDFKIVKSLKQAHAAFHKMTKPLMFKAIDSSGSRGIIKVTMESQIQDAVKKIYLVTKHKEFIIEEFINGTEFGAQACVVENSVQFIMPHGDIMFEGDAGVPVGHYVPYKLDIDIVNNVEFELKKCIHELRLNNCAINADFILKDNRPYLIEIGARVGATCLAEMVSIHYDMNYYEHLVNIALGKKPNFTEPKKKHACAGKLIYSNKSGVVKEINIEKISKKNIYDLSFDYVEGDLIKKFNVGPDRVGQLIVKEKNVRSAIKLLDSVNAQINLKLI